MLKETIKSNIEEQKDRKKSYEIIVNATKKNVTDKNLSFEEVIVLAFEQYDTSATVAYTVTYSYKKGHHNDKGILVKGDSVKVKEGMVFNVTRTTRS